MYDKISIVIIVLVMIGFVVLNLNTPVVEGLKNPFKDIEKSFKKTVKSVEKGVNKATDSVGKKADELFDTKSKGSDVKQMSAASVAAASVAAANVVPTTVAASSEPNAAPTPSVSSVAANVSSEAPTPMVDPAPSITTVVQTSLPVDFKEVQGYLEKLKTYSTDAQNMSASVSSSVENYKKAYDEASSNLSRLSDVAKSSADNAKTNAEESLRKMDIIQRDIATKAMDIQAQVNSNNIVKNELTARINEMRDIQEKVSDKSIGVKESEMNAAQSAEEARKSLAGILPTAANNVVLQRVEGFTGFNSSVLEGYTVYSMPSGSPSTNAFDLENDLVDKINKFNIAYYGFLSGTKNEAEVNIARTNLNTAIDALNTRIGTISTATPKISNAVFDASHSYIKTTAAQIDTLRSDLDMKMQEIIKTKHGVPTDYTIKRDVAAYTTILWTALATSALYFVFVKMD